MGDQRTGMVRSGVEPDEDGEPSRPSPLTVTAIFSLVVIGLFLVTAQEEVDPEPPTTTATPSTSAPAVESTLRPIWTQVTALPFRATGFSGSLRSPIRFGDELVALVFPGALDAGLALWTSADDGASWTEHVLPEEMAGEFDFINDLVATEGGLFAVGTSGAGATLWRTTDLVSWDELSFDNPISNDSLESWTEVPDITTNGARGVAGGSHWFRVDFDEVIGELVPDLDFDRHQLEFSPELRIVDSETGEVVVDLGPEAVSQRIAGELLVIGHHGVAETRIVEVGLPTEPFGPYRWEIVDQFGFGFGLGKSPFVAATDDGGLTWVLADDPPFPLAGTLIDTDTGFSMLGARSLDGEIAVWRSVDGRNWAFGGTANGLRECLGENAISGYPVFIGDVDGGFVHLGPPFADHALCRGDGLMRWVPLELPAPFEFPTFSADAGHLLATGITVVDGVRRHAIYYFDDAGWRPVELPFTPRSVDPIDVSIDRGKVTLFHRKNVGLDVWTASLP